MTKIEIGQLWFHIDNPSFKYEIIKIDSFREGTYKTINEFTMRVKIEIGQIWFSEGSDPNKNGYIITRINDDNYAYCRSIFSEREIGFGQLDSQNYSSTYTMDKGWHFKWSENSFCKKGYGLHRSECKC